MRKALEMKIDKFANNVDPDEVAQNEPTHLDLHCLPSSLWNLNMIRLEWNIILNFADENFVICFLVGKEFNTDDAKSDGPDRMALFVASYLGIYCLPVSFYGTVDTNGVRNS